MTIITPEARKRCEAAHTLKEQLEYHKAKIAYHLDQRRKYEYAIRLQDEYNVTVGDMADMDRPAKGDSGV